MTDSERLSDKAQDGILHGTVGRGAIAGAGAATVVALWFLLVDGVGGQLFRTPAFLARVVIGLEPAPTGAPLSAPQVAGYTLLHYGVFLAVGIGVAWILARVRPFPAVLLGAVLGFLLFDLLFYGGVWFTGVDVVAYLGWPEVLVGNVLAGISLVGVLAFLDPRTSGSWGRALAEHHTVREGLVAGLIGATTVAVWFLVIDLVGGRILLTPGALGSVLFHGASSAADVRLDAVTILAYTGVHLAAFFVTGLVAAAILAVAEDRHPYVLLGAVLLFVTFETFFIGVVTIVAQWLLEIIPWWSIAVANLAAAAAMGTYLGKRHPALIAALGEVEIEREPVPETRLSGRGAPGSSGGGPGTP